MLPKVSVCIITYNHENYIRQCLNSVFLQDYPNFNVVIADDCSTDKTVDVINEFVVSHPGKIKLVARKKNIGAGRNLQHALSLCDGEYISLCEGDDFWLTPSKLSSQVKVMEAAPSIGICFHPAIRVSESGDYLSIVNSVGKKILTAKDVVRSGGGVMPTCSLLFRANTIRASEDWLAEAPVGDYFYQAIAASIGGAICDPTCLGAYRVNSSSSMTKAESQSGKRLAYVKSMYKSLGRLKNTLGSNFISDIEFRFNRICFWNLKYCIYKHRYKEAFGIAKFWALNNVR